MKNAESTNFLDLLRNAHFVWEKTSTILTLFTKESTRLLMLFLWQLFLKRKSSACMED